MPGWAFHNIILFLRHTFKHRYDIYFDFCIYNPQKRATVQSDLGKDEGNSAGNIRYKKNVPALRIPGIRSVAYRLIRRLNLAGRLGYDQEGKFRRVHPTGHYDSVLYLDYYMDKIADFSHIRANKTIKGIYTDGFPPKGVEMNTDITPKHFCETFLSDADALVVGSPGIRQIYAPVFPSVFFVNMAYDETLFSPKKTKEHKPLVLGWTGNPDREFKGYHQIIVPAVEQLRQEGYDIELKSRFSGPFHTLPSFWHGVDVALIASQADAGPSLFMEASLCGVPSISTRIGMPAETIRDGENGFFCEPSVVDLKEKIMLLYHNRPLVQSMGRRIRADYMAVFGVDAQTANWETLFERILDA